MRPGGLALTEQLLGLCALPEGAKSLDVGCGQGQTVDYRTFRGDSWSIDLKPAPGERLLTGDACALPFEADYFDALIFECSLSTMDSPDRALREAVRVLKPKGTLYMADVYLRHEYREGAPFPRASGG